VLTIVARWETSQLHPLEEWQLWRQMKGAFGIDRFVMVPKQEGFDQISIVDQYDTMEEALESTVGERVFLEPTGTNPINCLARESRLRDGDIVLVCGSTESDNIQFAAPGEMYSIHTKGEDRHNHLYAPNAAAIALAVRLGQ
jgi:hypothetical protein